MIEHSGQLAGKLKQPSISHKARDEIAEAVAMAAMIEGQARAEAKARQREGGAIGAMITNGAAPAQLGGSRKQAEFTREARDEIAEAVGLATTTLRTGCGKPPPVMRRVFVGCYPPTFGKLVLDWS